MNTAKTCILVVLLGGIMVLAAGCPDEEEPDDHSCTWAEWPNVGVECDPAEVPLAWEYEGTSPSFRVVYYCDREDKDTLPVTTVTSDTLRDLQSFRSYRWFVLVYESGELKCEGWELTFTTGGSTCFPNASWPKWTQQASSDVLILTDTVTLAGNPVRDIEANSFRIRLGLDPGAMEYVSDYSAVPEAFVTNLLPDETYYWQCEAYDGTDLVCAGLIFRFRTARIEPPYEPNPADGAGGVNTDVLLSWQFDDVPDTAISFDVTLETAGSAPIRITGLSAKSVRPPTLVRGKTYEWSVAAYCDGSDTAISDTWTFTTSTLDPPYNPDPPDGATGVVTTPVLSWDFDVPPGALFSYDVHLATPGETPIVMSGLSETEATPQALFRESAYEWYVVAYSTTHDTVTSDTWTFTTAAVQPDDIYAQFMVETQWFNQWMFYDFARARFDSVYNPSDTVRPLQAGSVLFNQSEMYWSTYSKQYDYTPYLSPGETHTFTVTASATVPAASVSIDFPVCRPEITLPANSDTVQFSGFDVEWINGCAGDVVITILKAGDSTGVRVVTNNDGAYSMTASDLSPLNSMEGSYTIVIILQNQEMIDNVSGYDPRSTITARFYNEMWIYME